jgi:hypothetical protein
MHTPSFIPTLAAAILALSASAARADYTTAAPGSPDPLSLQQPGAETYANGIMFRNLDLQLTSPPHSTLSPGNYSVNSFFDVFTELSLDGGQTWLPQSGTGSGTVQGTDLGSGTFHTEMLSLDLSLPGGVLIRESPTLTSAGETDVTGPGPYQIHSFFDVFTELSLDGGQTWSPQTSGPARLDGMPEPATLALFAPATLLLLRRRNSRAL